MTIETMKVFVGYESSGVVREAFRARGHDAWSCDYQAADDGSPYHLQGDVWAYIHGDWDLRILHPTCTYLTISAGWAYADPDFNKYPDVGYHQRVKAMTLTGADRRRARNLALEEIRELMALSGRWCIENPVGVIGSRIRPATQTIHPYQFGDDASKRTCLWLQGLDPLIPTEYIPPRIINNKKRWGNQTDSGQNRLPPSEDRWKARSKTYQGIADAMAAQWGGGDFNQAKKGK